MGWPCYVEAASYQCAKVKWPETFTVLRDDGTGGGGFAFWSWSLRRFFGVLGTIIESMSGCPYTVPFFPSEEILSMCVCVCVCMHVWHLSRARIRSVQTPMRKVKWCVLCIGWAMAHGPTSYASYAVPPYCALQCPLAKPLWLVRMSSRTIRICLVLPWRWSHLRRKKCRRQGRREIIKQIGS